MFRPWEPLDQAEEIVVHCDPFFVQPKQVRQCRMFYAMHVLVFVSPQDADEERLCYLSDDDSPALTGADDDSPVSGNSSSPALTVVATEAEVDAVEALVLLQQYPYVTATSTAAAAGPKRPAQPARPKSSACHLCGESFLNKQELYRHSRQAHSDLYARFSCRHCGQGFKIEWRRDRHQMLCDARPFATPRSSVCDLCGESFGHKQTLYQHKRQKHFTAGLYGKFWCRHCGRGFKVEGYLERHQALGVCFARRACQNCGQSFPYQSQLTRHMVECCRSTQIASRDAPPVRNVLTCDLTYGAVNAYLCL